MIDFKKKKIVVADMDGTLTLSKQPMDQEMSELIDQLLEHKEFAVIGGGKYSLFQTQLVERLAADHDHLSRLYLFPTCATTLYRHNGNGWKQVYAENLEESEKNRIMGAIETALKNVDFEMPQTVYGTVIEDRGTQISFSANGQLAPLEVKSKWDPDHKKRLKIKEHLNLLIPEFDVKIGGTNTIDITKGGIDKGYGINKISEYFGYKINEMFFIGDALYEGGNDYPVKQTGVDSIQVSGPEETKELIKMIMGRSV